MANTSSSCATSIRATSSRRPCTSTKSQVEADFRRVHTHLPADRDLREPEALLNEARKVLRAEYFAADVGITGANFLIAETGTSIIVTNEGNGDLTQILPKVHIVVASIEKIVPTLEDASQILRVLARSATGQDMSVYTTLSTGPRRPDDADGPEEYHVVLLDNGRSAMLGTEFQDMLRCIRCGACMNHCPVYHAVGGHAYGWVYPGPMGAVLTPSLIGVDKAGHLPNASTFCGRCESVCPMKHPAAEDDAALARARVRARAEPGGDAQRARSVGILGQAAGALSRAERHRHAAAVAARRQEAALRLAAAGRRLDQASRIAGAAGQDLHAAGAQRQAGRRAMSGREAILGKVRTALKATPGDAARLASVNERMSSAAKGVIPARGQLPAKERVELFCAQAVKLFASVERLASVDEVPEAVASLSEAEEPAASIRMGDDARLTAMPWASQGALEVKRGASDGNDEVGVSHAFARRCRNRNLVMVSGADNPTTINFLPEHHIVVVDAASIEGDLETAIAGIRGRFGKGEMPRTVNLISGPSRSGDIEQKLILGAHGPRALHLLVVGE